MTDPSSVPLTYDFDSLTYLILTLRGDRSANQLPESDPLTLSRFYGTQGQIRLPIKSRAIRSKLSDQRDHLKLTFRGTVGELMDELVFELDLSSRDLQSIVSNGGGLKTELEGQLMDEIRSMVLDGLNERLRRDGSLEGLPDGSISLDQISYLQRPVRRAKRMFEG
ncbi:hypothetical protein BY996DRAFT_6428615 [Phakopsora pachyrhizi]|uniref:Expressed protein n=1 Tax=Phakopsora pachyrhizi TaxID=170000 RepID=A0AAV0AGC9_PHAPC|nr:hypothetical protein BY996DRAFT_6428615 [Phakopsora pachyrhizi]CAH7666188.1 expressed protein [Phakopsora pachyrhizi]